MIKISRGISVGSVVIFCFLGCLILSINFSKRFGFYYLWPMDKWVQYATFFNNALSPILLLTSVLLLFQTWRSSHEALSVQKRELKATKEVLKEQSDTQNFSVFKEALFEVIDSVDPLLDKEVILVRDKKDYKLITDIKKQRKDLTDDEQQMPFSEFLSKYFLKMNDQARKKRQELKTGQEVKKDSHHISYEKLLLKNTYKFRAKIKAIALLFQKQEMNIHRETLEIIIFQRLTIFTWLMFLEVYYQLSKDEKNKEDQESAKLVFQVIAGLTCRQLKEVSWLNALSPELHTELKNSGLI